ncbi:MAG TPA: 16S rRNA (uracil(1498)-N(3))-methyltransferase [Candidatus Marinimicrobia bacterium]|jgi:16S rRNA (uracil1498-N3)-methyltransferase|nr:16S rRNA (uracil(1498)-N(3))-methyltransferase [Candidatus Neomarinimicrobiota bacterium]HIB34132.1 16S rRNA (uracil(1498)-N(3))-methyltransferase [Candidatus Neomarinimicrobiota bacterium]|tara:strand:- start:491 stop:1201 length:711 start_codon:yes stop_codon:yes gene_type:complete
MEEHFFHLQLNNLKQDTFKLSEEESRHFVTSLRGNAGDDLWLLDGLGTAYEGTVLKINGKSVSGIIHRSHTNYGESHYEVHLAIGLIKGNRMDMIFEKATEMGVKSIHPLMLDRCVKNKLKMERANRIVVSASKQAGRSFFPIVFEPVNLTTWLNDHVDSHKILCHITGSQSIAGSLGNERKEIFLIIGPEGDFSKNELYQLKQAQIEFSNLGPRRLRSESAAMMAIAMVNQLMEN